MHGAVKLPEDRIGIAREEGAATPRISYQEARAMAGIHGLLLQRAK